MRQILVSTIVTCLLLSSVGCGTFCNQSPKGSYFNHKGDRRPYRVYGGVRTDFEVMYSPLIDGEYKVWPLRIVFGLVDLPFSLVTDTVALPFDVHQQWRRLTHSELYDEGQPFRPPPSPGVKPDGTVEKVEAIEAQQATSTAQEK